METEKRRTIIQQIADLDIEIAKQDKVVKTVLPNPVTQSAIDFHRLAQQTKSQLMREKVCLESRLDKVLPITFEGFLGEDEEQVDQNEHGIVNEVYHWLGCPSLDEGKWQKSITYNRQQDITEILKANSGRLLRVTIEAVEIGDGEKCPTCTKRFQCLTTR